MRQKGPGKHHVLEALSNLGSFIKTQRKKINLAIAEKRQKNGTASASQASTSSSNVGQTNRNKNNSARATQGPSRYVAPSFKPSFPKVPGGMEDVD